MDISLVAGTLSMAANQGLGFVKLFNRLDFVSNCCISVSDSITEQVPASFTARVLQLAAAFPVATIAPPPVRSTSSRSVYRTSLRRKRRVKRRLYSDDSQDGEDNGFGGDDSDGPYGGGSGGGGRGWNFDGFGGHDWDESSSPFPSNSAYYFVYEVVYWIALSNCVHFAFKKVVRFAADAIGDSERAKWSMRLISVC